MSNHFRLHNERNQRGRTYLECSRTENNLNPHHLSGVLNRWAPNYLVPRMNFKASGWSPAIRSLDLRDDDKGECNKIYQTTSRGVPTQHQLAGETRVGKFILSGHDQTARGCCPWPCLDRLRMVWSAKKAANNSERDYVAVRAHLGGASVSLLTFGSSQNLDWCLKNPGTSLLKW